MERDHMQMPERPPSYTQSHDPQTINLPSAPNTDFAPIHNERTLPPLPSAPPEPFYRPTESTDHKYPSPTWPSSNPLTAYYQPTMSQSSPTSRSANAIDSPGAMEVDITTPDSRGRRGGSVLSIDDPDVRIAAEALGDLRAADFIQSPPQQHSSISTSPTSFQLGRSAPQPEPLLSLLTTSHPLLGTAIGGSLSAYSASKNYSPRFKSSAEYVERRFTPVVNTVSSVGRVTGVEGGVRWFLGGRRPGQHQQLDLESGNQGSNKRRKTGESDTDTDRNIYKDSYTVPRQEFQLQHRERERRLSQTSTAESLPAYDEHRSPSYEAHTEQALVVAQQNSYSPTSPGSTWQSRLVLSTSGLSVAMSEESLRSLKYCLSWLRWANEHIGKVINALKSVLEQYDGSTTAQCNTAITNRDYSDISRNSQLVVRNDVDRLALHARIAELKSDVLKTLKDVVDIVSRYAGGALPDNARILVRRHLTSLPQRFKVASTNSNPSGNVGMSGEKGEREVREGARRVLVLAKEGVDMMAQVSGVLDGTIASAEEWCERLGRKKRGEAESEELMKESLSKGFYGTPETRPQGDVKMG